jgi:hypothetical protein
MTQFAYFTGEKPIFENQEFIPIGLHHTKNYVGSALSELEIQETWVMNLANAEPIDEMACEAMIPAQTKGAIENTRLYRLVYGYIHTCKAITFIYGNYDEDIPIYADPAEFINEITKSLSESSGEIYAKYSAT